MQKGSNNSHRHGTRVYHSRGSPIEYLFSCSRCGGELPPLYTTYCHQHPVRPNPYSLSINQLFPVSFDITPFVITVTGRSEIPHPAERALINVHVASSGTDKATVSSQVISTAKTIESLLRELSPQADSPDAKQASALPHWSKTSLSFTSHVPYGPHGGQKPRQYDARIGFDIRLKEFKAVGSFGTKLSDLPHVEVNNILWILTPTTEKSYGAQLRKEEARDARQKALDYCEVLGCTNLRPVVLSDDGRLPPVMAHMTNHNPQQRQMGLMSQQGPCVTASPSKRMRQEVSDMEICSFPESNVTMDTIRCRREWLCRPLNDQSEPTALDACDAITPCSACSCHCPPFNSTRHLRNLLGYLGNFHSVSINFFDDSAHSFFQFSCIECHLCEGWSTIAAIDSGDGAVDR
ncbi:hypothetical protein AUP68_18097 [Ilyonectria robusta]